jgi:murein DD-endopeptidase MepM/ murein hydrolase activator NlpD
VWVWPLPSWQGYAPTVTDGFLSWRTTANGQRIRHNGVDVMYERKNAADQVDTYPPGTPTGSPRSFMPLAIPVLAVRDATVWSADRTDRGYAIVLDHGPPWASFYQHLSEMFVVPTQRGASKQRIRAGDVIGHVGADPTDREGLRHLHFELWLNGNHNAAIDPCPLMKSWYVLPSARPSAKPIV